MPLHFNRLLRYIGIDIGKRTFTAAFPQSQGFHVQSFANDEEGFRAFQTLLLPQDWCVLEATGNYGLPVMSRLLAEGVAFSVINPLQSRQFAKVTLSISKTDRQDACLLSLFGERMRPAPYRAPAPILQKIKQKRVLLRQLKAQRIALIGLVESRSPIPDPDAQCSQVVAETLAFLERKIEALQKEILTVSKAEFAHLMGLLTSIKGVGPAVAAALIEATNGFTHLERAKQFIKYIGLAPTTLQSGSSIRRNGRICRSGSPDLRALLYMCAMTAVKYNSVCKEFYLRLKANGKASKAALVAVAAKLIRQAFAIVKSGKSCQDGYKSLHPKHA